MRKCISCGESKTLSEFPTYGESRNFRPKEFCRTCKTMKNRTMRKLRNENLIQDEIALRGSRCQWEGCHWDLDLVWHHREPDHKQFKIGASLNKTNSQLQEELAKCDLLCPNHHAVADREIGVRERAVLLNPNQS